MSVEQGELQMKNLGMQQTLSQLAAGLEDTDNVSASQAHQLLAQTQKHIDHLRSQSKIMEDLLKMELFRPSPLEGSLETQVSQ